MNMKSNIRVRTRLLIWEQALYMEKSQKSESTRAAA